MPINLLNFVVKGKQTRHENPCKKCNHLFTLPDDEHKKISMVIWGKGYTSQRLESFSL